MEQNHILTPEAATDEPAFSCNPELGAAASRARRHRHDGWTPERQTIFLEALAACGVVADACRQAGLSAGGAYAFRNRRAGRAFATAWDAVLVHRARGRLSDELLSRSMNGWAEAVYHRGEIIGERQRFDNRLSMAVLTRLDRLAERVGERDDLLRAVSEDLDDFLDCVDGGGDADAFVEARRQDVEPPPAAEPATGAPQEEGPGAALRDDLDRLADLIGYPRYSDMDPASIDISDLPEGELCDLDLDQYLRARYSGYLTWLEIREVEHREVGFDPDAIEDRLPTMYMNGLRARRRHYLERQASRAASPEEEPGSPSGRDPAPQPSTSSTYREWSRRSEG